MRVGIIFLLITTIFSSCSKSKVPKDLLTPAKMQEVYWDYLRADAFVNEFVRKDSTKNIGIESARLQNQVFQLHKTTRKQFYSSYDYYMHRPELMKPLLDTMIHRQQQEIKKPDTVKQRKLFNRTDTTNKVAQ